jgi:hypothetical protein
LSGGTVGGALTGPTLPRVAALPARERLCGPGDGGHTESVGLGGCQLRAADAVHGAEIQTAVD